MPFNFDNINIVLKIHGILIHILCVFYFTCRSNVSYTSIWSPAITPVSELMSGNTCMQRASSHHHQMASGAAPNSPSCYSTQSYGPPSSYHYTNMDYLATSLPHHHNQFSSVTTMASAALNPMNAQNMSRAEQIRIPQSNQINEYNYL